MEDDRRNKNEGCVRERPSVLPLASTIPPAPYAVDAVPGTPLPPVIRAFDARSESQVALALAREGLLDSARLHLSTVIQRAPLAAEPYFALALLEIEEGDHDAAEAALSKALHLAPTFAERPKR
jgi:tetratricopeptide (TPR) repeat protein